MSVIWSPLCWYYPITRWKTPVGESTVSGLHGKTNPGPINTLLSTISNWCSCWFVMINTIKVCLQILCGTQDVYHLQMITLDQTQQYIFKWQLHLAITSTHSLIVVFIEISIIDCCIDAKALLLLTDCIQYQDAYNSQMVTSKMHRWLIVALITYICKL
jgi:hypothetical protein